MSIPNQKNRKVMTKKKNPDEQEKDHNLNHKPTAKEDKKAEDSGIKAENNITETGSPDKESTIKEEKKEISTEEKLAEMVDKYIRLSAEFDNYRKRTLREKIDLTKSAGEDLLKDLIPVMDDFERALKLMDATKDCEGMKSGIELIYNKFASFLKQNGVKEIEAMNKVFNVDLHEAVTKIPAPEESLKGKVVDVVLKGYYLNNKVMRFSKVVVGE